MKILIIFTFALVVVFTAGWGAKEMDAHYTERQYQFEWELQQRTIAGVLNAADLLIQRIKE